MTNTAGESKHFKTSDGVKLHYLGAEAGQPLVMIPSWSQPAEQFKYQINGLHYTSGSSQLISSVVKKPANPITISIALLVFRDSTSVSPVMVR